MICSKFAGRFCGHSCHDTLIQTARYKVQIASGFNVRLAWKPRATNNTIRLLHQEMSHLSRQQFSTSKPRRQNVNVAPRQQVQYKYPQALQIYHGGVGQTATVGMLKACTIFFFVGACLVAAPAIYVNPEASNWSVIGGETDCDCVKSTTILC